MVKLTILISMLAGLTVSGEFVLALCAYGGGIVFISLISDPAARISTLTLLTATNSLLFHITAHESLRGDHRELFVSSRAISSTSYPFTFEELLIYPILKYRSCLLPTCRSLYRLLAVCARLTVNAPMVESVRDTLRTYKMGCVGARMDG